MTATDPDATVPDFDPEDYEGLQPRQTAIHPAELRKLRKADKENAELKAQLAEANRREQFARAGIPIDDPAAKYFVRGYDGDLTAEAIRAAAVEARVIAGSPTTPEEIAAHQAAQAASAGGTPPSQAPDATAALAELARKQFAPGDDMARSAHIAEIARLARENQWRFPTQ